jgi:hypothetical protein
VPVLFTEPNSIYTTLPHADPYDVTRDATTYAGHAPIIAHPPCQHWSVMRHFARTDPREKELAIFATALVRRLGGILEHPASSNLWPTLALPVPGGLPHQYGGHTIQVDQFNWGHIPRKRTWLYIVGIAREDLPTQPIRTGKPSHAYGSTKAISKLPTVPKSQRTGTPLLFALWLLAIVQKIPAQFPNRLRSQPQTQPPKSRSSYPSSLETLETS